MPKRFRQGTHRQCSPEETLERVRRHLPALGITRIANVTGLDCIGIPVVMACRPNSRSLATSQGKGLDLVAAKVSGVMESIELFHGEHIMLPLTLASWEELAADRRVVEVDRLATVRNSRFHPRLQILWIEGHDLFSGEAVWIPFETVHVSGKLPAPQGSGCFASTSNGLASGNHLLEALLHALCEVVERDATAVWAAGGQATSDRTRLDLATVDDPACLAVVDRCRGAGARLSVWETTSDVGAPAFFAEVSDPSGGLGRSSFGGMGCHPTREIALLRALTEAVQSRLTVISGSRDDLFRSRYGLGRRADHGHRGADPPASGDGLRAFGDVPTHPEGETFNEDLHWLLGRLRAVGVQEAVTVDLTRAEYGIPVVRVVVPRLEGPDEDTEYVPGARALAAAASR